MNILTITTKHLLPAIGIYLISLLLGVKPTYSASIGFTPNFFRQLDGDPILDRAVAPLEVIQVSLAVDPAGLPGAITSLNYDLLYDNSELRLLDGFKDANSLFDTATLLPGGPVVPSGIENINISHTVAAGKTGIALGNITHLDAYNFRVRAHIDDGAFDLKIQLNSASVGGTNVTNMIAVPYGGASAPGGIVAEGEVQAAPEPVGTILGSAIALGIGGLLKRESSNKNKQHKKKESS